MAKYLVSIGDSDKYAVDFPGSLNDLKNSDIIKGLKDKASKLLSDKFPMGGFADIVPVHIEETDSAAGYTELNASTIDDILKSAVRQIGVEKFTDKLNLNAPFDKD